MCIASKGRWPQGRNQVCQHCQVGAPVHRVPAHPNGLLRQDKLSGALRARGGGSKVTGNRCRVCATPARAQHPAAARAPTRLVCAHATAEGKSIWEVYLPVTRRCQCLVPGDRTKISQRPPLPAVSPSQSANTPLCSTPPTHGNRRNPPTHPQPRCVYQICSGGQSWLARKPLLGRVRSIMGAAGQQPTLLCVCATPCPRAGTTMRSSTVLALGLLALLALNSAIGERAAVALWQQGWPVQHQPAAAAAYQRASTVRKQRARRSSSSAGAPHDPQLPCSGRPVSRRGHGRDRISGALGRVFSAHQTCCSG